MKCVLATCVPYHHDLESPSHTCVYCVLMPHLYENGSILTHYSISFFFHLRINLGGKYSFSERKNILHNKYPHANIKTLKLNRKWVGFL